MNGSPQPCRDLSTSKCRPFATGTTCPINHENCNDDTEWIDVTENQDVITSGTRRLEKTISGMVIEEHTDTRIVVLSQRGYGRTLRLKAMLGIHPLVVNDRTLRYQPPTIRAFETLEAQQGGASNFRPGDTVALLGYNFGFGGVGTAIADLQNLITVRLGSEYDAAGNNCATSELCNLDQTFKLCSELIYHPEYLIGSKSSYRGFPYVTCKTLQDVAGRKNWSLSIAGEEDSCATNSFLCADADNWPIYRDTMNPNRAVNISDELNVSIWSGTRMEHCSCHF